MTDREPPVHEQVDLRNHGAIEASAGTGKTYAVEHIYYRLLSEPHNTITGSYVDIENILVVTYTEKAVGELRTRIRAILQNNLTALRERGTQPELTRHIHDCLNRFDHAAIHTIHSFCKGLLDTYAFESKAGMEPELVDTATVAAEAFYDLLRFDWKSTVFRTPEQLRNLLDNTGIAGPARLARILPQLAAAVSPAMSDRILPAATPESRRVIEEHLCGAHRELVDTFGAPGTTDSHPLRLAYQNLKSSAQAHKRSLDSRLPSLDRWLELLTVESQPDELLQWYIRAYREQKTKAPAELTDLGKKTDPQTVIQAMNSESGMDFGRFLQLAESFLGLLRTCRNARCFAPLVGMTEQLFDRTHRLMRENNRISYNDMIELVWGALSRAGSRLTQLIREQYSYGIIDEFQDTNALQWDIFRTLFLDPGDPHGVNKRNVIYVVGDPKQSIFSFQGADVRTYMRAVQELRDTGGAMLPLGTNYRSTPQMSEAHNVLFGRAPWFDTDTEHIAYSPVRGNESGGDRTWTSQPLLRSPITLRPVEGASVGEKQRNYALWVVNKIEEMIPPGGESAVRIPDPNRPGATRPLRHSDIAILVRKHAEAEPIVRYLTRRGIPYTRCRDEGVLQSSECRHLITVMEAIDAPEHDLTTLKKALLTPFFGWPPQALEQFDPDRTDTTAPALFARWREMRDRGQWAGLLRSVYESTGIFERLALQPEPQRPIAAHRQLAGYVLELLLDQRLSLGDTIRTMRSLRDNVIAPVEQENVFNKESEDDRVQIMTIYTAKGLGFGVVFLAAGCGPERTSFDYLRIRRDDGGTDYRLDKDEQEHKECMYAQIDSENRRLYYVALTRARYKMFLPLWHDPPDQPDTDARRDHTSPSETFLSSCLHHAAETDTGTLFETDLSPAPRIDRHDQAPDRAGELPASQAAAIVRTIAESPAVQRARERLGAIRILSRYRAQTSYSALAHGGGQHHNLEGRQVRSEEPPVPAAEFDNAELLPAAEVDPLPPGPHTGNMLHEVLERISFETVRDTESPAALAGDTPVAELVQSCCRRAGIAQEESIARTYEVVWNVLHAAVPDPFAPDSHIRLCELPCRDRVPEMEFHFGFDKHGSFGPCPRMSGNVLGYIDLMFRAGERYYVLDWKSDALPDYSSETITAEMHTRGYDIQQMLYALAADQWLDTRGPNYSYDRHFGGLIYCYLRGMRAGEHAGCHVTRPRERETLHTGYSSQLRTIMFHNEKLRHLLQSKETR